MKPAKIYFTGAAVFLFILGIYFKVTNQTAAGYYQSHYNGMRYSVISSNFLIFLSVYSSLPDYFLTGLIKKINGNRKKKY
jgi:hypothetical protein